MRTKEWKGFVVKALNRPSLTGTLGEAFRISGRGTVLIVEDYTGDMPAVARMQIGKFSSKITGVDFPRKITWADDGSVKLDRSRIGLLIEDDAKEQLRRMKGQPVEVFECSIL